MALSPTFSPPVCFKKNTTFSPNTPKFHKPTTKTPTQTLSAIPPISTAADLSAVAVPFDGTTLAVIGGGSVAALAAVLSLTDPERRRQLQAEEVGGGDKEVVKEYFNNSGFQRWKKIYGETDDVNKVQLDIRLGHSKTVENVMKMLTDESGAIVTASDISAAMVAEAEKQVSFTPNCRLNCHNGLPKQIALAREELLSGRDDGLPAPVMPKFEVKDLESLDGKYHTVVCLDVLIHYPQSKADGMIAHLASLAEKRLILSFAPKTFYYDLLKRVGELFPGPSKATRAYLHAEADVERALQKVGWRIRKRGLITTQFYFAKLVEAVPA
ncbi:Magnesium protoporphyrin IX methyltransferase, chloroplastic [Vitis vinifera]|uniref:Magnesium protoporphyrin IX methyltransferase, chloroplastic n=1 Tax=Vitis vinifera TaxID=29760 RepID=A0A438K9V5_VITVI|nr:Magnesium protoporphyrin IX methyltransferase, chloroplastic [Vitis vinifera]